jgi:hypothetical protein
MRIGDPTDPKNLAENLAALSDDELIDMINIHFQQYRPDALIIARAEMLKRGYHISKKGKVTNPQKAEEKPNEGTAPVVQKPGPPLCPRCRAELEYAGTRRLNDDKEMSVLGELGEMFKSGAHEFLDVYICRKCGHVDLFVDGIGEEFRPY